MRQAGQSDVFDTNPVVQSGCHAEQHTRCLRRFDKKAMHCIAKYLLESERDAARCAADTAWQIHKQRALLIRRKLHCFQLIFQPLCRNCISQKQIFRIFIIYKIAVRSGIRQRSSLLHRTGIIAFIFFYRDTILAQQVFFPLPRIGRHMHNRLISNHCAHNTNAQAQISCRADLNGILMKKILAMRQGFICLCAAVFHILFVQQSMPQCQFLCMFEYFINTAARLDRTRDCQIAVLLQQQRSIYRHLFIFL